MTELGVAMAGVQRPSNGYACLPQCPPPPLRRCSLKTFDSSPRHYSHDHRHGMDADRALNDSDPSDSEPSRTPPNPNNPRMVGMAGVEPFAGPLSPPPLSVPPNPSAMLTPLEDSPMSTSELICSPSSPSTPDDATVAPAATAPVLGSSPSVADAEWRFLALDTVDNLWALDDAAPFRLPVDQSAFPDYLDFVRRPIDLSSIRQALAGDAALTFPQFVADVRLIFANSRRYNPDSSASIWGMTTRLGQAFEDEVERLAQAHPSLLRQRPGRSTTATTVRSRSNLNRSTGTRAAQRGMPRKRVRGGAHAPAVASGDHSSPRKRARPATAAAPPAAPTPSTPRKQAATAPNSSPRRGARGTAGTLLAWAKQRQSATTTTPTATTAAGAAVEPDEAPDALPPPSTAAQKAHRRRLRAKQLAAWKALCEREMREERRCRRLGVGGSSDPAPRAARVTFSPDVQYRLLLD